MAARVRLCPPENRETEQSEDLRGVTRTYEDHKNVKTAGTQLAAKNSGGLCVPPPPVQNPCLSVFLRGPFWRNFLVLFGLVWSRNRADERHLLSRTGTGDNVDNCMWQRCFWAGIILGTL